MAASSKKKLRTPLELLREKERGRREVAEFRALKFKQTRAAKIGQFLNQAARTRRKQLVYARDIRRPLVGSGLKQGKGRGRPKGSYDPRYRNFGGVYGYRKVLNAQLRQQKLAALRDATISPQQKVILARADAQEFARLQNPENRIIPDTQGAVPLRSIHQEIEDAANIFP